MNLKKILQHQKFEFLQMYYSNHVDENWHCCSFHFEFVLKHYDGELKAKSQKHLEWLAKFNPKKLKVWSGCKDITPLTSSPRLEALSLAGCSDLTDFKSLGTLKRLKKLELSICFIKNTAHKKNLYTYYVQRFFFALKFLKFQNNSIFFDVNF